MKKLLFIHKLLFAILSAVLLALAIPNEYFSWGNPALGLIALVPLYLSIFSSSSYKEAILIGAIFGGMAHGLSSYWLWFFKDFRFWTLGTTIMAYMIVYGFLAMYLRAAIKRGGLASPFLFAMVWAVFEWGKSSGFLGYPWGLLAYSWNTIECFIQIAESTGVYGISFVLAAFSASIAELLTAFIQKDEVSKSNYSILFNYSSYSLNHNTTHPLLLKLGYLFMSLILILAVLAYGSIARSKDRNYSHFFNTLLVQANTDPWEGSEAENLAISIKLARQALENAAEKPDLILFSETTLRRPYKDFMSFFRNTPADYPLTKLIIDSGAYLFVGAPEILDYDNFEATNSVILINPQGTQIGSYAKIHPVPFAEAIPFWEYAPVRHFIQNVVGLDSGWVMGTEKIIFKINTQSGKELSFAGPICFEDAVASLCRSFVNEGAELLINLTNDAWSRTKSAEIQHFVAARFRAVELRRTLLRSTNGGVSGLVLPDGSLKEIMPLFTKESRLIKVPVYQGELTPYLIFGDWFAVLLSCILLFLSIMLYTLDIKERGVA